MRFVYACNGPGSLNDVWHSRWQQAAHRRGIRIYAARHLSPSAPAPSARFARSRPDVELPDIQFHFLPLSADRPGQGLHTFSGVTATVCQLRPESRGTLSHRHVPIPPRTRAIVSNYLGVGGGPARAARRHEAVRRVASQPAFASAHRARAPAGAGCRPATRR